MKGLVLKDIINLNRNWKIYVATLGFLAVFAIIMKDPSYFTTMVTLVFAMLIMTSYSYDEIARWDSYALTLPVTKSNIVQAKYLMMLLTTFMGFTIGSTAQIIYNIVYKAEDILAGMQFCTIGTALIILFYSITMPIITKLGMEKAKYIFMVVYAMIFLIGYFGFKIYKDDNSKLPKFLIKAMKLFVEYIYIIIPVVVLAALWISYRISIRVYRKKEF